MAAPGLVAAAMFAFMTAWNDYLFAVILTTTMASKTVPVVVAGFVLLLDRRRRRIEQRAVGCEYSCAATFHLPSSLVAEIN